MTQNYRNQSGRPDYGRGGRYQTGSERDRYRTGGEQRFNPEWDDRSDRAFEGERSYSAGGYPEEFGYRGGHNRDENEYRSSDYQSRSAGYQRGRSDYGQDQSRYGEGRFDEGNRWSEGARGSEYGGIAPLRWNEDEGNRGSYFATGNYVDPGDPNRGLSSDFYRAREQQMRYGTGARGSTRSDFSNYGNADYGSQSSYGRNQQRPSRSEYQRGGGSSGYGTQQGGSVNTGAWDRSGTYTSDYGSYVRSQSFRGRGPQGYQRSDERLKEIICERLTDDPAIDASNITIEVTGQIVKLTGTVDDRSTKYEVEELIESCGGVKDIDNQLRVQSGQSSSSQGQGQGVGQTGQQLRGGSDWDAGSSSVASSTRAGTTTGSTGASSTTTSKRN
jgi:osmotically-inducible protein OsmY